MMTEDEMLSTALTNALERFPGASGCEMLDPMDVADRSYLLDMFRQELDSLRKEATVNA